MAIKAAIFGAFSIVLILSWLATWQVGKAYLAERDKVAELALTNKINELTQEHKEAQEQALSDLRSVYDKQITDSDTDHLEKINDLTRALLNAQQDAMQTPIEFGDSLIRNFIRVDCLWSKGTAGNSVQGREACDREAENADPSNQGVSFAVLTPNFLATWRDACSDWETIGTAAGDITYDEGEWKAEYGNFDVAMCDETLVAMTPEFSLYLNTFIENGRNYTSKLLSLAEEQNETIDILMERYDEPEKTIQ